MDSFSQLRRNIQLLGTLLGDTIRDAHGAPLFDKVEQIRRLSKAARTGGDRERAALSTLLQSLELDELVPVARAFSHFLSLANTAEQLQAVYASEATAGEDLEEIYRRLGRHQLSEQALGETLDALKIELVLTAHPTEVTRRSIINKHSRITQCLRLLDSSALSAGERDALEQNLRRLIAEIWHTPEIRSERPTPVDEAKWGFAVIENSLWRALPDFLRTLDHYQSRHLQRGLPVDASPVRFVSWMGGDRDGNPHVTAATTREVLLLSRWKAADLFLSDVRELSVSLSMTECTDAISGLAGSAREPYRAILHGLESRLENTRFNLTAQLRGSGERRLPAIDTVQDLWQPLLACYRSLHAVGIGLVADGDLLDTLRRVRCFGIHLVRLDIRQESGRHEQVMIELCHHLGLGDYAQWSEPERQRFLLAELDSPRPLLPPRWQPSAAVQEILDTCRIIAGQPREALGAYIISMARQPSDVLAVKLLLAECGCAFEMPVAPLFETLDDLDRAAAVVDDLLSQPAYHRRCEGRQMVMIGYSDSSKDAGVMAAAWAQYQAQEGLLAVCARHGVDLTLFQGRGGTIGRGGAPARAALLSQPPGSLRNGLRVTEQGEMIRFKLGLPDVAVNTLKLYTSAILEANLAPPPVPRDAWRLVLDRLAAASTRHYRGVVRGNPDFIAYFHQATPASELGELPLGSRPASRNPQGGIESLRAIPWQFAWMQNRLLLPAWLGAGAALREAIAQGAQPALEALCRDWPFFSTRIALLEMVYAKSDAYVAAYYDRQLVEPRLWPLGEALRGELGQDIRAVLDITNDDDLMRDLPWARRAVELRSIYIDPLHILQAELLARKRRQDCGAVNSALMITITGIAAGLRNTG